MSGARRIAARALLVLTPLVLAGPVGASAPVGAAPEPWATLFGDAPRTPPLLLPLPAPCEASASPALARGREAGRSASGRRAQRDARDAIARELQHPGHGPRTRACLRLASTRLALALGLLPEAAAEAALAAGELEVGPTAAAAPEAAERAALAAAARWLALEARHAAGRGDELLPALEALAEAEDPALRRAAELRRGDLQLAAGDAEGALATLESALAVAPPAALPLGPFALRAAEAAAQAERPDRAAHWLERAVDLGLGARHLAVARLRLAELAIAAGRLQDARAQLEAVRRVDPAAPAARFAEVREVALALDAPDPAQRRDGAALRDPLAAARAAEPPALAAWARLVHARVLLRDGRPEDALASLLPLLVDPAWSWLGAPLVAPVLDAVLAALAVPAAPAACPGLVAGLARHEALLLRRVREPAPLVALAGCEIELGFAEHGVALLRRIARHFGAAGREAGAAPLVRGLLATGEIEAAAAAARERARFAGGAARWRLLLAAAELARGDADAALAALRDALDAAGPDAGAVRADAARLLARIARARPGERAPAHLLADVVLALPRAQPAADPGTDALGDAALQAGHAARRAGELRPARRLYARAAAWLAPGERRAQAHYWRARLADTPHARRRHLSAAAAEPGGAWAELARHQLATGRLAAPPGLAEG